MNGHFKEVIPVDTYRLSVNGILQEMDKNVLTLLYQPLIGAFAYSLYMTLWSEFDAFGAAPMSHQHLMNMSQFSLKDILLGRKKLEAIGLLKTFKHQDGDQRQYLYELQQPLSPDDFFTDGFLNIYLYNRVGKTQYMQLKSRFEKEIIHKGEYEEVTSSFSDVFTSLHPSEMISKGYSEITEGNSQGETHYQGKGRVPSIQVEMDTFDFELMTAHVSSFILPKEILRDDIKEAIIKLAYIYKLSPMEMSKQIQNTYYTHGELSSELLRKEVQKWYRFENYDNMPALALKTQPLPLKILNEKEPVTDEEKMIKFFEEVSPYHLLEVYGGGKPAEVDLNLVAYLMIDQNLPAGVVNVLLDYVMKTNDMKLIKKLVERIGSHWARKKIQKVPDAMSLARTEKAKYAEWTQKKKYAPQNRSAQSTMARKLPDWLKKEQSSRDKTLNSENEEENKKWLENLLKDI